MVQEVVAGGEKIGPGAGSTDAVKELPGRFHTEPEIVHVLLHPLDLG